MQRYIDAEYTPGTARKVREEGLWGMTVIADVQAFPVAIRCRFAVSECAVQLGRKLVGWPLSGSLSSRTRWADCHAFAAFV